MLEEEKRDNLQNADGQEQEFENVPLGAEQPDETAEEVSLVGETEGQLVLPEEELPTETGYISEENNDAASVANIEEQGAEVSSYENISEENHAVNAIATSNAEESEDETLAGRHEIPMQNYEALSMEALTDELEKLAGHEKVMQVKEHVEEIRKEFYSKYNHFIEEKRDEFSHDNNGDATGFEYHFPLKGKFDTLYNQYRDKKNSHFKKVQNDLKGNLDTRLAIINELKSLVDGGENIKDSLKRVNDLRERWKNAGPIPRDKYNHVWNNFHFHIERFYDQLHLDREVRDLDFKHNLEQKQKIVARVEELVNEADVPKAFRELQALHKIWKEEIGPVSREHRETLWNRFSELTRQLHDKREALGAKIKEQEEKNLAAKKEIIAGIEAIAAEKVANHNGWQGQIERVEALRKDFFNAGKVPLEVNEETWAAFKDAVRKFNSSKNSFYKDIKKDQQDNLNRKQALVEKARSLQDSEDFGATTPVMKQIQDEWKTIGHVPRKYSDTVWKEFKAACNHYFDRLHAHRNEANKDEMEAFDKKKEYLEKLKDFQLTGEHKADLDAIKKHIENWKAMGRVPQARRHIEGKFNKILDALFDKLSLSKKETDMVKFNNRLEQLSSNEGGTRALENEQLFIMRKVDELQGEIFQLENNIQFFSNAKGDNPLVKEVKKNIERHKEELKSWKDKLKQLRSINQNKNKSAEEPQEPQAE